MFFLPLDLAGQFFCHPDIFDLCALVAATEEDDACPTFLYKVHPVAGAVEDTKFEDTLAYTSRIATMAVSQAKEPERDASTRDVIFEVCEPLLEDIGFLHPHNHVATLSEAHFGEAEVVGGAGAGGPEEFAVGGGDGEVVD